MRQFLTIALFSLFAIPAAGQVVLFEDDFSSGIGSWTSTSIWHWAPAGELCVQRSSPPPGYGAMAHMGRAVGSCGFQSAPTNTPIYLTMRDAVEIPTYG